MNMYQKVWKEEKALLAAGALGFLLAAFCAIVIAVKGAAVLPEGNLFKAISFNAALGLFLLTTAFLVTLAGFGRLKRRIFRWSYIVLALYSYGVETIQNMRGFSPRYSTHGGTIDIMLGAVFGLVAVLMIVYYIVLAWPFFRSRLLYEHPLLTLGIRYGMVTTVLSFASGLWMIAIQGRYTGLEGNIIWFHGLGFHGLQAMPIFAWLLSANQQISERLRRQFLHMGGIAWILSILLIGWQTVLGYSIFHLSPIMIISCGLLMGLGMLFIIMCFAVWKNNRSSISVKRL